MRNVHYATGRRGNWELGTGNSYCGGIVPSANLGSLALRRLIPNPLPRGEGVHVWGEGETLSVAVGEVPESWAPGGDDSGPRRAGRHCPRPAVLLAVPLT